MNRLKQSSLLLTCLLGTCLAFSQPLTPAFAADQALLPEDKKSLVVYLIGTEFSTYAHIGWPKQILMYVGQTDSLTSTLWYSTRKKRIQTGAERTAKIPENPLDPNRALLVFDWSRETVRFKAKAIHQSVAAVEKAIEEALVHLQWDRSEIALHLFAHSRGSMVTLGLAQRYMELGHTIDLVSLLDPHPVAFRKADLSFPWVSRTTADCIQPQKRKDRCLFLTIPPSIQRLRNYYRQDGRYEDMINFRPAGLGQFDGLTVEGAENYPLDNTLLRDGKKWAAIDGNPHVEILAWYFGVELNKKGFPAYEDDWLRAVQSP